MSGASGLLFMQSLSLYGGGARVIHVGDRYLPPLVEVPGVGLPLARVVKPPDPEALWEWSCEQRGAGSDMDVTWASVWPAAAALAAHLDGNRHLVEGLRVVELGSGLGVAGPLLLAGHSHCATCCVPACSACKGPPRVATVALKGPQQERPARRWASSYPALPPPR